MCCYYKLSLECSCCRFPFFPHNGLSSYIGTILLEHFSSSSSDSCNFSSASEKMLMDFFFVLCEIGMNKVSGKEMNESAMLCNDKSWELKAIIIMSCFLFLIHPLGRNLKPIEGYEIRGDEKYYILLSLY